MALEQKLSLKLSQKLVMTPSLQQAIKLLQMTRLELEGVLSQELEENPILEQPDDDPAEEELEATDEESPEEDDRAMDDIDLDAYFNEYLEGGSSERHSGTYEPSEGVPIEATVAAEQDLYDHLLWQLHTTDVREELREVAELIIGNLDADGFLAASVEELQLLGASDQDVERYRELERAAERSGTFLNGISSRALEESRKEARRRLEEEEDDGGTGEAPATASESIESDQNDEDFDEAQSQEAQSREPQSQGSGEPIWCPMVPGYPRPLVEEAIDLVRSFDPPGVACRSLRKSLLLQLEMADEKDSLTYRLVDEFWEQCLRRQFPAIAKEIGVPLQELKAPAEHIRTLETRPGRRYGTERTHYVEPDVHVVNVGGRFVVQVNDDGLPRLRVSGAYRKMLRDLKRESRNSDAQQYIKEKMRSAMWLIKSLDQRQRTIYKVAESIVKQQQEFFERGIDYLRPMVLRDVADDIEMHESTVSRVVSNKYMHTPRGLYPMKFFFHSGIDRDMGEDISSLTVKRKIKNLIEAEEPKKPLSDSALTRKLKAEGIQIARRTVAKYRDELRIPSSTDRKEVF